MDFLKDIAKTAGNEYAALVSDGVEAGDVDSFNAIADDLSGLTILVSIPSCTTVIFSLKDSGNVLACQ